MPIVEADNGQSYDFPDGTTPAQMTAYLMKVAPPKQQQSPMQNFKDVASQTLAGNPFTAPLSVISKMHPVDDIRDVAQGVAQGVVNAGALAYKGVKPVANLFGANLKNAPDVSNIAAPIGSGKNGFESNLARGLGEYIPYGATAEVAAPVSILGRVLAQTTAGGVSGAANATPGQSNLFGWLPSGKLGGAIEGAATNLLTPGVLKVAEDTRPVNAFRGALPPEKLAENLAAAKGTSTGLGDVLGNKQLKIALESQLPSFPGTGATDAMLGTANNIQSNAQNIFKEMLGGSDPNDVMKPIQDALRQNEKDVTKEKVAKQNLLNQAAEKAGVLVGRDNQQMYAKNKLAEINEDPELKDMAPKEVVSDLEKYASGEYGPQKLKAADISGGGTALGSKANSYFRAGQDYAGGIYNDLIDAKKEDVDAALDQTSNDTVRNLRDDYRKFYAEEYAPYKDKDIKKFTTFGKGDTDLLLKQFIKTNGTTERPRLLDKLMTKLKPNQKNLVTYGYYSPSISKKTGQVDLGTLRSLHEALGEGQQDVLFSGNPEMQQKMNNLVHSININPEPMRALANPQTGIRTSSFAPMAAMAAGARLGYRTAGFPGAVAGTAAGLAIPAGLGKIATKALTNEPLREKLVKAMLNPRQKFNTPKNVVGAQALAQALMNAQQNRGQ